LYGEKGDSETNPGTLSNRSLGEDTYPVVLGEDEDGRDRSKSCKHAVDACTDDEALSHELTQKQAQ
jgi:hypothetical protein